MPPPSPSEPSQRGTSFTLRSPASRSSRTSPRFTALSSAPTSAGAPPHLAVPLLLLLILLPLATPAAAHGFICFPMQRGLLRGHRLHSGKPHNDSAPIDPRPHFPAGSRESSPGAALRSQIAAFRGRKWSPFVPTSRKTVWRSRVCGDSLDSRFPQHERPRPGNPKHIKNFYNHGEIVATYRQGQVIDVKVTIVAHHNGFMELHVCDVAKCGGEISPACFRNGHCRQLRRAPNPKCDSGRNRKCGPIDRKYPGRWYLPCSLFEGDSKGRSETYGGDGTILYKLPSDLNCEHCVVQWFWTAANTCNPPGVIEYFTKNKPSVRWPRCKGQGGAIGGYTAVQKPCGFSRQPKHYPEEYLQCADIRIRPRGGSGQNSGGNNSGKNNNNNNKDKDEDKNNDGGRDKGTNRSGGSGEYDEKAGIKKGSGAIRDIVLVGNGKRQFSLVGRKGGEVDISRFSSVSVEAIVDPKKPPSKVQFSVNGRNMGVRTKPPYYILGKASGGPRNWAGRPLDKRIKLTVRGGSDTDTITFKFVRR